MRIAQLATNVERVPPTGYGGTELIVSLLTEELVRRGHEVTLFASGDSTTTARLISTSPVSLRTATATTVTQWTAYDMRTCLTLEQMQEEFDIVHNHMGYQALPFLNELKCAVVTTLHNQIKDYCRDIYIKYSSLPFVAISKSYAPLNYQDMLNYVDTIYNGIDVDSFHYPHPQNRDNLLFVGRLGHDKGTAAAIDIARELDLPINLAGKIDKSDESYYLAEIQPRIKSYSKAEYIGEVNHEQKVRLYANAIAVVYPINFNEPFGLVMAESLAAGTPVMALDRGSVSEILENGTTAIIGNSTDELVARFHELSQIDPDVCRQRVREHFGVGRMVDRYEELYRELVAQRRR